MAAARRGWRPRAAAPLSPDQKLDRAEAALASGDRARAHQIVGQLGYIDLISTGGDTAAALRRIGRARWILAA